MTYFSRFSIATKLYAIFTLLAISALGLARIALNQTHDHAVVWTVTGFALAAIFLAVLGILVIGRAVATPLANLTEVTSAIAEGANSLAVPYGDRRDEIGALSRSISVFQSAVSRNEELSRTVFDDAQARSRRQEAVSSEITHFAQDVEATLAKLGAIAAQMAAASDSLTGAASQASERTRGARGASGEASSHVSDIASAAEELAASVMEIDRQVAQSTTVAEKAVVEAERTTGAVRGLDEAAKRIGDVVKVITAIAEQTNLLALNATIEAARAGEAGRGFAVVANEVKALAGQTGKATEEIAAQIGGMQRATTVSVEAIEGIRSTIREIGGISSAIAAAVTEQGAATQEIARSVDIAAKRTLETAQEISRAGDASEETSGSATSVKEVATELQDVADRMRGQIDGFLSRLNAA
jgi:methyl-accepting chemotaxis protein